MGRLSKFWIAFVALGLIVVGTHSSAQAQEPVKIGILHSLSGTMAISEVSLRDAVLMAVEEINSNGGVLGRKIDPVVVDPASRLGPVRRKVQRVVARARGGVRFRMLDLGVAQVGVAGF